MSAETAATELGQDQPADHITVPVSLPRQPEKYRATTHFGQRLRERVPEIDRGAVPRLILQRGEPRRQTADKHGHGDGTPVALTAEIDGEPWTMIVALRPAAFVDAETKHRAVTLWQGRPEVAQ